MAVRIGINGLGRIGRAVWRLARHRSDIEVAAVNDLSDAATLAHLLRYDSVRGRSREQIAADGAALVTAGGRVPVFGRAEPGEVPWGDLGVDVVVEATGRFTAAHHMRRHLDAGARRVLVSTAAPDPDVTLIVGVNEQDFDPARHRVVSPGCCTANAVAPVLAVLRQQVRLRSAYLTSVHAYDSTHSSLQDGPHRDPRIGRAAAVNMIPVQSRHTAHAVASVFPELAGRFRAMSVRVPVAIGCMMDLVATADGHTTADAVNAALAAAAAGELKGYLGYTAEPVVSSDVRGATESCVVDAGLTAVLDSSLRVVAWYDNEWGFAGRLLDMVQVIGVTPG
jgi:glyceraldehyde 3-phosphate dehydrogenase